MLKTIQTILLLVVFSLGSAQDSIDHDKIKEDLYQILNDISKYYPYLEDKNVDLNCLLSYYENQIPNIKTEEETVLFFEYLLDEFYDSHLTLNTNRNSSYRLYSPIYVSIKSNKAIISNIWQTQLENLNHDLIGAEVVKINNEDFEIAIEQFPTYCSNKKSKPVKEWISNKILSGRYNQPRILTLRTVQNQIIEFNLEELKERKTDELLTSRKENNIGIIRINNSLGNNNLINEFDKTLKKLKDTKGLIIDLRNTVDGGNSYVARGIMGRFIKEKKPYQKHQILEKYNGSDIVERSWTEYVSPRGVQYQKPVVVLVGRWTGSMGEGLAIGFEGMGRAEIVGSEMERLAGEMNGFLFKNQAYGYRLSVAKLYHVNGVPREKYIPTNYVNQTTTHKDEVLVKGMDLLNKKAK